MRLFPRPLLLALSGLIALPWSSWALDTVSLILIDGEMREDWPDRGVVGFRRLEGSGPLVIQFSLGGTALATEYSPSATNTLTIPDGEREAWLEFAPTGQELGVPLKSITVNLQSSTNYQLSAKLTEQSVKLNLGNLSNKPSAKAAVRFLNQAAFGPDGNLANVKEVMNRGYEAWIDSQFKRPVALHQPYLSRVALAHRGRVDSDVKLTSWWNRAMNHGAAADVLRQRVGFALSEILVISDRVEELYNQPIGMANYYDVLLKGAFGNYRDLLYKVGTHPCMGIFLNHLQNEKGDPDEGTFADENFAREIMQLFSIGLWELNPDGTRKLDGNSQPIPSYDNVTIANMARVMTGFSWGGPKGKDFWYSPDNYTSPMRMWDEYHDRKAKILLNGVALPHRDASDPDIGTAGIADFNAAIDCLFNHPNIGPFISKQLIQKLVTSNPSAPYVGRVAAKFADNGQGVRGDLKAVIKAILLDSEARDPAVLSSPTAGKLKEPYLRTVSLARAVTARAANGSYPLSYMQDIHFQQPYSAPSVFSFFKPGYMPSGPLSEANLVAPEFEILNDITALSLPNYYMSALQYGFNRWGSENPRAVVRPHLNVELALVNDIPALMRRLDLLLTGGTLSNEQHQLIREAVEQIDSGYWQWKPERIWMAIYLITSTPEAAILQ